MDQAAAPFDLLTDEECRVLGSLVEKALTTPEYYPLSLKSLMTACNQKSNRRPVVQYDEDTVERAHEGLRRRGLGHKLHSMDSRVPKYNQNLGATLGLDDRQVVLLCELLLRGPQTLGELRQHTARMMEFDSLAEVDQALEGLITGIDGVVLAAKLPRQPGEKECRYSHLLSQSAVELSQKALAGEPVEGGGSWTATQAESGDQDPRLDALNEQVEQLRNELEDLREEFRMFKKQFE